jgi:hypothetical protein
MKLKEALYFLGLKPKTQIYGFKINKFELSSEGAVSYANGFIRENQKK